jgi:hypothetical protein
LSQKFFSSQLPLKSSAVPVPLHHRLLHRSTTMPLSALLLNKTDAIANALNYLQTCSIILPDTYFESRVFPHQSRRHTQSSRENSA